jgi:Zn-dependent protease
MMEKVAEGLLWYVAFLFSTTLHEASHAFVAWRLGDSTAYEGGQVTLDPIPHIRREPIGTVLVPLVSFALGGWMIGWASVPYDPRWAYENPRSSAKMSAAGPAANLVLALLAALAIRLGIAAGIFNAPDTIDFAHVIESTQAGTLTTVAAFINVFFSLNLLLFIFNLLPLPPLDGSGIIPLFLSKERAQKYLAVVHSGSFSLIGIMVAWNVFDYIYDPLHLLFINILFYPIAQYH